MSLQANSRELCRPIPPLASVDGWQAVPICECGESLIPLSKVRSTRIVELATYFERGFRSGSRHLYVRSQVAEVLEAVASELPSGLCLAVFDAWRPTELQREIFEEYMQTLRKSDPAASEAQLVERTKRYVSFPANNPACPAPHLTGGAVDLTLADGQGQLLPMGTDFDYFGPEAATRYYEERSHGSDLQSLPTESRDNRRLLFQAMIKHGFTNYPEEWWHFDYGNQFWAKVKGLDTQAIYGPANPGNLRPSDSHE